MLDWFWQLSVANRIWAVIGLGFGLAIGLSIVKAILEWLQEKAVWLMAQPKQELLYTVVVLVLVCLLIVSITLDLFLARSVLRMERINNEQWKLFFWLFLEDEEGEEEEPPATPENFLNVVNYSRRMVENLIETGSTIPWGVTKWLPLSCTNQDSNDTNEEVLYSLASTVGSSSSSTSVDWPPKSS